MRNHPTRLKQFFLPRLSRAYALRLAAVTVCAFALFRFVLRPVWIRGGSMEPTHPSRGFNFCFCLRYRFAPPQAGDIVTVRIGQGSVMFLKRVVAVAGETVEFRCGRLFVDGVERPEPYVNFRGDWQLVPRRVRPGNVYVVGDNRGMPMRNHNFGQTSLERIVGGPLW